MITAANDTVPLRVTFVGHVDHGKSTLIGRILFDAGALSTAARADLRREEDGTIDFAFAVDALREERERHITIDTTRTPFVSETRPYEIIDAPGHPEFLKNMLSGATSADTAVLIVDASLGLEEQTFRHALLLRLVGVQRILVAVNKMDLCDFDEERYRALAGETEVLLGSIGSASFATVPISARHGDNVFHRSDRTPWYEGPTILEALDVLPVEPERSHPLRFPVQDVLERDGHTLLLGRVEGGSIQPGRPVRLLPRDELARVREVRSLDGRLDGAAAGDCPAIVVDAGGLRRGDVLVDPNHLPLTVESARVTVFWMRGSVSIPTEGAIGEARVATQLVPVRIRAVNRRFESATLDEIPERDCLAETDVAEVVLDFERPIVLETHNDFPPLGRITIESSQDVLAAGIVRGGEA
jgi:bifunctional enzyme CysN/CysC